MKTRYDVEVWNGIGSRHEDLKEAFDLAKATAKEGKFTVLRKVVWDSENRIIEYKGCIIKADGSFEYL